LNSRARPPAATTHTHVTLTMASNLRELAGITYMSHQETAIRWMMQREQEPYEFVNAEEETHYVYGGILADEMGLGKTISVIGLMLNNQVPRTLVVGPVAVLSQWGDIAAKAGFTVFKQGVSATWDLVTRGSSTADAIYLVNYERILANPALTHEFPWDRIVLDEAHKARNPKSQVFEQIMTIKSVTRWVLTGTPIVNKMKDLVALYRLIGSECVKLSATEALKPLPELMLARTRAMLRSAGVDNMPGDPKVAHIKLDFASTQEETFYKGIQGGLAAKWDKFKYRSDRDAIMMKLQLMLRLRQLSVHPQVYIDAQKANSVKMPDWVYGCTKFEYVKKMLAEFPESDGTVIFCSFRREIEMLQDYLNEDTHCFLYYGGMTEEQRTAVVADAKASIEAGQRTVMLVQINSGGTGLNLQFMNRAIFMSPWWTAALMDQAIGRIVRFGQEKKTFIYHIHLKQEETEQIMNIDNFIFKKTQEKRILCRTILKHAAQEL
jgi:SNF2 family DNA or RNA helicase